MLNKSHWSVPFDWIGIKIQEVNELFDIIENIEDVKIEEEARKKHIQVYLNEIYLKSHFEELKRLEVKDKPAQRDLEMEKLNKQNLIKEERLKVLMSDGRLWFFIRLQLKLDQKCIFQYRGEGIQQR